MDRIAVTAIATATATSSAMALDPDVFASATATNTGTNSGVLEVGHRAAVCTPPHLQGLRDRELRIRCLEFAHQGDRVGRPIDDLLKRAQAFEAYVKGTDD